MIRTVWVTGVNGFSGRHFVAHIRRMSGPVRIVGFDISASTDTDIDHYERIDLTDTESLVRLAGVHPPSHVLHCAASLFEPDAGRLWEVNVHGTAVLINSLRAAGLTAVRILCIGSAAEYARCDGEVIFESNRVFPKSEYGKSKLAQSLLALSLGLALEQQVIVARTFNLIGPGTSENLVPGALLQRLVDNDSDVFQVFDAYSSRDFIDVRDAVSAYWALLLRGKENRIYNVCSGESTSIGDLANMFVDKITRKVQIEVDSDERADASHILGSNEKLREDVGWAPKYSVETSVADMVLAEV